MKKKRRYNTGVGFAKSRHKENTNEIAREQEIKQKLKLFKKNTPATFKRVKAVLDGIAKSEFISVHEYIVDFIGDGKGALILSYLLFMENKLTDKKHRWFVVKYQDMVRMLGVREKKIKNTITLLRELGIIDTEKRGMPAMQHYKLHKDVLIGEIIGVAQDTSQSGYKDGYKSNYESCYKGIL